MHFKTCNLRIWLKYCLIGKSHKIVIKMVTRYSLANVWPHMVHPMPISTLPFPQNTKVSFQLKVKETRLKSLSVI
jgi:hypothetical protein